MAEEEDRGMRNAARPPCGAPRAHRWVSARVLLILALAAASVTIEVLLVYYNAFFSSPVYNTVPTVNTEWKNGELVVTKILSPEVSANGLREGDRVFSVILRGGREIYARGRRDQAELQRTIRYGQAFDVLVLRTEPGGKERNVTVRYPAFPATQGASPYPRLANMAPSILSFLACLAAALLIGLSRPEDEGAYSASLMFFCFGALNWRGDVDLFPPLIGSVSYWLWALLFALVTATLLWFCLRFPSPSPIDRRLPWLKRAGVAFGLGFAAWNGILGTLQSLNQSAYDQYLDAVRYYDWGLDVVFCLLALVGVASLFLNLRDAASQDERSRLKILLCGMLGLVPWFVTYLNRVTVGFPVPFGVQVFVGFTQLLFPISFIYAVVRHRVFGIRVILRRGLQFALLSKGFLFVEGAAIFAALYFAAGPPLEMVAGGSHGGTLAVGIAGISAALAVAIGRANTRVMGPIERRFFREAYDARSVLTSLTLNLRRLVADPDALCAAAVRAVSATLHPRDTALFLRAGLIAGLPSQGEKSRLIRPLASREHPSTFLCFWRSRGLQSDQDEQEIAAGLPLRLSGDSFLAGRMAVLGDAPSLLNLDPKDRRSDAPSLVERASPGEVALLEGMLGARLVVPLSIGEELLGFLCLGEKLSEEPYSREDLALLAALAQQMADTLDHARLLHQSEEQAQLRREVEIAQQVQRNLLPAEPPAIPGLDLAGICRPARYVGGDYYDFIRVGDGAVAMVLGDISGKGISAALLMAALQATLREKSDTLGPQPSAVLSGVNARLHASAGEGRFSTLFYGVLDAGSGVLEYSNAGHNPPFLLRPGEGGRNVRLEPTGTLIGIFPDSSYEQRSVRVAPGDLLVAYSDGITEAMNEAGEFFEEERLADLLPSLMGLPAVEARDRILGAVEAFTGSAPQADDITLVVARVL